MSFRTLKLRKNPTCPVCSEHPTQTGLIDYEAFCGIPTAPATSSEEDVPEMTVQEYKQRLDEGTAPFLLDVRKPYEYEIANLGAPLIPVDELENRLEELASYREREIVVHCRSGVRSARAVRIMRGAGFSDVKNLTGGILAWSKEIDPSLPEY